MNTKSIFLFLIPTFIWGSTWYVIKFQIGETDPLVSVGYRFGIAGILLLVYCLTFRLPINYPIRSHLFMALQGVFLFGFNYFFVYLSEAYLTSGLVAAAFSLLIFFNVLFGSILLRNRSNRSVILGAILGVLGICLVFYDEIKKFEISDNSYYGILFCLIGIVLASLGNITSTYNQRNKIPIIQANTFGMIYGSIALLLLAFFAGRDFGVETSASYLLSLFYLSIFGSIVAFSSYLKLIGKVGPERGAFVMLVVPIIALLISSVFEDFEWTILTISGLFLIVSGNLLSSRKSISKS